MTQEKPQVLIVGATSAIARETARLLAMKQARMFLVGLEKDQLELCAEDLSTRGADIAGTLQADLLDLECYGDVAKSALEALPHLDTTLFAQGLLGDQKQGQTDHAHAEALFRINFLSVIGIAAPVANFMEEQKRGKLAVISSVAGDRGRQSNYMYGSAKGALSLYTQGLRNRLQPSGVKVLTFKPGFVDTPMTAHLPKNKLYASPEDIAQGIVTALDKNRNGEIYLPGFWWLIMTVIRHIPGFIFNRMKL